MRRLGFVAAVSACFLPAPAPAQSSRAPSLDLGGYVRTIAGGSDLGYDIPGLDRRVAFNGTVVRFKWLAEIGDQVRVNVHNRFQVQFSSSETAAGGTAGFGVSRVPSRSVDLTTDLVTEPHVTGTHSFDRLSVTLLLDAADITIGRQAITWGISTIFPVADLWAQFSPFELDTGEKPGVDAIRALSYPGDGLELDLVVADRGQRRLVSGGIRATRETAIGDVYVAAAKSWREVLGLAGAAFLADAWKLRAEIAVPWNLDRDAFTAPRFTLGADRIGSEWTWSVEYHFNGFGTTDPARYVAEFGSPEFSRGQSYYVGRHLLGAAVVRQITDRLTGALTALSNLHDPSATAIPALNYDAGQNLRFSLGALAAAGARPVTGSGPVQLLIQSEFGTYGNSLFATGSLFF